MTIPPAAGGAPRRVPELGLARHRLLLLAVKEPAPEPRCTWNPAPAHVLSGDETLIILGEPERVRRLSAEVAAG